MRVVFHTMYMHFGGQVFKQIFGFPMGSPLSPDAANLFMALVEDLNGEWQHVGHALHSFLPGPECLKLFKRLIDDYTIILAKVSRTQVRTLLNELDRRLALVGLKVTWVINTESCDTLDLHVYKPPEMRTQGKLAFRTHQKLGNRYQYLARSSMHNPPVFRALVKGELCRHAVNCSSHTMYWHMAQLFWHRLQARGYTRADLTPAFDAVPYSIRQRLLYGGDAADAEEPAEPLPLVAFLKAPYDGITASMELQSCMRHALADAVAAVRLHPPQGEDLARYREVLHQLEHITPMLCWQRAGNLGGDIMRSSDS
jgi:hypothetical protein